MNTQELINEIRYSLPSKRMLEVVNSAIIHIGNLTIVLKNRRGYSEKEIIGMIEDNEFELYSRHYGYFDFNTVDLSELDKKDIEFSKQTLGHRGLLALSTLADIYRDCKEGKIIFHNK